MILCYVKTLSVAETVCHRQQMKDHGDPVEWSWHGNPITQSMFYIRTVRYTKVQEKHWIFKPGMFVTAFTINTYCPYSESTEVSSYAKLVRSLSILSSNVAAYFKISLHFTAVKSGYRYRVEVQNHHSFTLNSLPSRETFTRQEKDSNTVPFLVCLIFYIATGNISLWRFL